METTGILRGSPEAWNHKFNLIGVSLTKPNQIVLDPFVGSGTTVIAAEKTGRQAYVLELDPIYCDTAIRRWEAYTGKHAVHVDTGYCFEEREELGLSTSDAEGPELPQDCELIDPEV